MKTIEELKAKAKAYFERTEANEIHVTTDGMLFVKIEHARSHVGGSDLKVITITREEAMSSTQATKGEVTGFETKEQAIEYLKANEVEAIDYASMKVLVSLLGLKAENTKKATLITVLTAAKNAE